MVCLVGCPAALGVGASSPLLVPALLGSKWDAAIPVMQVLSLFGLLSLLTANAGYLYLALGRPDLTVKIGAATAVLQVGLMLLLTPKLGVVGTAAAYSLSLAVVLPVCLVVLRRTIGLTLGEYVRATGRAVVSSAAMYLGVAWTCTRFLADGRPTSSIAAIGPLAVVVLLGAGMYVVLVVALWFAAGRPEGPEAVLWRRARGLMPQRGSRGAAA
jgi:O-antigen/teichoic acid export membrane protein